MNKPNDFYSLSANSISGKLIDFKVFKGKTVLIVNTASKCGFTPQYQGLEKLHQKYNEQGLIILGFPCNQFGKQEPGTEKEIQEGCLVNYGVSFKMCSKIEVNGKNTHSVYAFLKSKKGSLLGAKIKWNFTKFLIDKKGKVIKRYGSISKPESLENDIKKIL